MELWPSLFRFLWGFLITKRTTVALEACHHGCLVLCVCGQGTCDSENAFSAQEPPFRVLGEPVNWSLGIKADQHVSLV